MRVVCRLAGRRPKRCKKDLDRPEDGEGGLNRTEEGQEHVL